MKIKPIHSLREYRKNANYARIFVCFEVLMEVGITYLMSGIIDEGILKNDLPYIFKTGAILILMAFLALFFGIMSGREAAVAGAGFAKNLRQDVFYKIQTFSFRNMDKFHASSLVTRLTTDVSNIQMAYMMSIRILARTPIMIIMSLVMTLFINPMVALLLFLAMPVLAGSLLLIAKCAHPHFIKVFREYDALNTKVEENVNAARVVKAFVREDFEKEKFQETSGSLYKLFTRAEKIVSLNSPIMQLTIYTVMVFMLYFGGRSIVFGHMGVGQLNTLVIFALQILMSLMMLTFVFVMNMISEASRSRVGEILNEVPEMAPKGETVKHLESFDLIFDHVSFRYGEGEGQDALKDVNLTIREGETIGIIGGTGSSKSTLVQLIPRLYDVSEGSVRIGGVDVRDLDIHMLRDQVSMVLQKNVLFSGTIYENIRWGDENASNEEVERVCRLAQADSFIQTFPEKYETMIVQGGNNVSGGQKQRLCIARALLKKPKILILDDSTSAVDTKTDALIRKAFREEIPGTTKIIIAQRISSVEDADRIIVLDKGQVSGFGSHEELLKTNEIYREIYTSQTKGGNADEA